MTPYASGKRWTLYAGDCLDVLPGLDAGSIDAIITDPPYPGIDRSYGRFTETEWAAMMDGVLAQSRRLLTARGSAVYVIQPNSERLGRMRSWPWRFVLSVSEGGDGWGLVQDAWWWNPSMAPTVHCQREIGLLRPSVKMCVWMGRPDCYRDQGAVLWRTSDSMAAVDREDRAVRRGPSGHSYRKGRFLDAMSERGGVTPFNLIPIANTNSTSSGGAHGHGAATPADLCRWWISYLSRPDDVVLDPFVGSGTVGIEALLLNRRCVGIERDPAYLDIAARRLAEAEANGVQQPLLLPREPGAVEPAPSLFGGAR